MDETEKTTNPAQKQTEEVYELDGKTPLLFAHARDPHIDVMKGIGMLLVLVYHMQTMQYLGYSIIGYSAMFIMPLFFFVNGYLFPSSSDAKMTFGRYTRKKVLTLLVPYAVFFVVSFLWTETIYAYATGTPLFSFGFDWAQALQAFFFAGEYLYKLAVVPFPIWFLHALFLTSLVFFFVVKIKRKFLVAVIAFALSLVAIPLQATLSESPLWFIRLFPLALFYMLCGYLFRYFIALTTPPDTPKTRNIDIPLGGLFSILCLLVGLYCMRLGGGEMWSIASYWHFAGGLISILGCYLFSRCTNNLILQFVGKYSILYLGLHPLILKLPFIEDLPNWFSDQGFDGIIVYIGYFAVSFLLITILVIAAAFLQKKFRRLLSRPNTKQSPTA